MLFRSGKHNLSVDEYKEKFLRLHKYAPEVTSEALTHKFMEGLKEDLLYMMKGTGSTNFLDAVAKAKNFEKMGEYNLRKLASQSSFQQVIVFKSHNIQVCLNKNLIIQI